MRHICIVILQTASEITKLTCNFGTNSLSYTTYYRTELDSYVNMIVMGKNSFVFGQVQNRTCEVTPYDPSIGKAKQVSIVDAAIAYDCEYTSKICILIFRNTLNIPTLEHNLITLYILNEGGIICNDRPKIQCNEPSGEGHCIIHKNSGLKKPLKLNGIFSFFHSRTSTHLEMENENKILSTLNSEYWNPYSSHYSENEESMIGGQGEVTPVKLRQKSI